MPTSIIKSYLDPLIGFVGERVHTRGYVDLLITFGNNKTYRKMLTVRYILIETDTSYNVLIARKTLNNVGVIVSTPHMAMKFPSEEGNIIIV